MIASALRVSVLLAGFVLPLAAAAPASGTTVLTPKGYRSAANAHLVPQGGKVSIVGDEIHLKDTNDNVIHTAQNDQSHTRRDTVGSNLNLVAHDEESGWVAYASWFNTGLPISSFTTTWSVPPVPATDHGQTVFLFNGIGPSTSAAILQPVLQYGPSGAGGGSYWAVATWYLIGDNTYHTAPLNVTSGAILNAFITMTGNNGSTYDYVGSFTNIPGTSITATGSDELVFASETLESYGVTEASDYPAGLTVFSDMTIENVAGTTPATVWLASGDSADGITTVIDTQGPTNAQVTITY